RGGGALDQRDRARARQAQHRRTLRDRGRPPGAGGPGRRLRPGVCLRPAAADRRILRGGARPVSRGLAAALAPVVALLVALAPAAAHAELARLELRRAGGEQQAVVRNLSGGTIEVELSAAAWTGMDGEPGLPL